MPHRFPSPFHTSILPPTPARLTALAATKLPRWGLLALCLLYIVTGLVMREPWKSEDVIGLAQMWTAYDGGWAQWLAPEAAGVAVSQEGPLATWVGALCMAIFSPLLGHILAGRIPNLIWFGIASTSLWYGAYLLGRRAEAQPLALPFGGQPEPRDYGRMLADAALLLLLATLGILWRSHETSAEPAALAFHALVFYSLARMLDHPRSGALTLGLALAGAFLARGFPAVLPPLLAVAVLAGTCSALRPAVRWIALLSLPLGLALSLAWWIAAALLHPYWMSGWWHWNASVFGMLTPRGLSDVLRNMPWFLWPTGPLALLALWRWRGYLHSPHVQIPVALMLAGLAMLLATREPIDAEYLALVIPCAMLAALALPTLRRGLINALDWFAVMVFSATACVVWMGWIAIMTGVPPKIARNIARQTPGFEADFSLFAFTAAVAASVAWIALIIWRFRSRPAGLWRGTVLSAGGVVTCWLLIMTLWLPSINYNKSYREVSNGIAQALAAERSRTGRQECVRSAGLGLSQRASFAVFDNLRFELSGDCPLVLLQGNASVLRNALQRGEYAGSRVLWEGTRAAELRRAPQFLEYFILLRPVPAGRPAP
ncbi:glycosyltransferase [Pigmentiphaga sp.]|uniref:ArnT family glycosyltransferase n=1 Tax=Pigmentiphaga sp. TaxID=1977564 RepID=UPI00128E901E|nr:glycosyltransferase [Pigmentiphaga sp.]MPS26973.1 glycosyltransferase [Alcaligenaceae bacterium SAGV5]MPS51889.1 glycosyltransferase [Alcaligenaceae bacterium SAGV3]MPT57159.1 glycosyltransferase [Alcaligenaceae bacterium]